ncbi:Fungal specific transcription factor domain-containing protein isoform 2 [Cladophialophora immunda]|nr:Fungal specific transcription factor domain-containing protein isoform 2 [Cladophialophora immunda]
MLTQQSVTLEDLHDRINSDAMPQPTTHHAQDTTTLPENLPSTSHSSAHWTLHSQTLSHLPAAVEVTASPSTTRDEIPAMTIPRQHSTTTESLLSTASVRALLGEFPRGMFLKTESARALPQNVHLGNQQVTAFPETERAEMDGLVDCFFRLAHREIPILDQNHFLSCYRRFLERDAWDDIDSALCLMVLAIGAVVQNPPSAANQSAEVSSPGGEYLSAALKILIPDIMQSFWSTIALPQATLLAAKYFGYLMRPLKSWRFIHLASTNVQILLNWPQTLEEDHATAAALSRLVWAIFDIECDLIAEHHLPRSGIEHVVENIPLPTFHSWTPEASMFLAEISARRLFNRVHHTMYADSPGRFGTTDHTIPAQDHFLRQELRSTITNLAAELDHQLETWFDLLPQHIKPELENSSSWSFEHLNILHRYHTAKDIIFRPFVMYTCNLPANGTISTSILERCSICVQHCCAYLSISEMLLEQTSSIKEIISHSAFAATVVLTLSSLNQNLSALVSDVDDLQTRAISMLQRVASKDSAIDQLVEILKVLQMKTRLLKRQAHMQTP